MTDPIKRLLFENDVKTYGTQAVESHIHPLDWFENDVKTYGTQAENKDLKAKNKFENDVKTYGTQAIQKQNALPCSLRMM